MIDFERYTFHPVVHLPDQYDVRDFTTLANANREPTHPFSIGRYDEDRVGMYVQDLFDGQRTLHVGVDIGAPLHTPVYSFWEGVIHKFGYNASPGDYGHVVITEHDFEGVKLWALLGHLSAESIAGKQKGQRIQKGEEVGSLGPATENGGWPVHLHFQLSYQRPETHDMPGVVCPSERLQALSVYPDPRRVLGPLY